MTSINKNISLHQSLPLPLAPPSFEDTEERYEWAIYQLSELCSILQAYIDLGRRTPDFIAFFESSKNCICNELRLLGSITHNKRMTLLLFYTTMNELVEQIVHLPCE